MEMVAHISKEGSVYKCRFFNTRLEMLIFLSGGEMKDYDTYECSSIFIGDENENLSDMLERTPTTQILF
jgi:hypothetical protein